MPSPGTVRSAQKQLISQPSLRAARAAAPPLRAHRAGVLGGRLIPRRSARLSAKVGGLHPECASSSACCRRAGSTGRQSDTVQEIRVLAVEIHPPWNRYSPACACGHEFMHTSQVVRSLMVTKLRSSFSGMRRPKTLLQDDGQDFHTGQIQIRPSARSFAHASSGTLDTSLQDGQLILMILLFPYKSAFLFPFSDK